MADTAMPRVASRLDAAGRRRAPALWLLVGATAAIAAVLLAALVAMAVPPLALAMVAIGLAAIIAIGISVISIGLATRRQAARLTARWGAIGDALPLPCCVVDRAGRAHYVNAAFAALCPGAGHAPLAALRRHIEAAGPTTSRGAAAGGADDAGADNVGARLAELATAAASGSGGTIAVAVPGHDAGGRPRLLRATAQPLADGAGHVLWTLEPAVGTPDGPDATSPAADDLVAALDQVPIGLYAVDAEGRFQLLNHALATWLGTTRAEVAAADLRLMDFVVPPPGPPPGSPPGPQLGPAPAQTPLAAGSKVVLRARDGTTFEATLTQSPAAGPASWACGLVQQAAVGAIPATDGRRQRAFEAAPMGIVLVTADGRVAESNGAWRAVVAVGSENPAGRPLSAFVAEDEAGRLATWLAQLATGRGAATPLDLTLRAASADGSPRIVTVFAGRMASPSADPDAAGPDPAGPETADAAVDGLVLHFLETTEQKTLEAKFAQGQKMQAVGQLAGGVAHDFNNLLTAMIGFCDLLLLRHSPGDQSFADIMQIKQNAARAANLVRQLLAFSRQQTMQPRVLNITDVLAELSNLLRRPIGAKIELEMAHGRNLDLVRVDQGQLEQVIINLAVNARDAMADGGRLTIRTHNLSLARAERHGSEDVPAGDYVVVEVRDTGVGVAAELRERIFEPFFTTKEVGEGTGLGLSTVYGIVKQTGGFLFLESQPAPAADHGTAFSIYLPGLKADAVTVVERRDEAETPAPLSLTGAGTVLLVEDENAVRMFGARALRGKGYTVLEANSGEAALTVMAAAEVPIDLLVTDVVMPEMDGPTLIKQVRATNPDLRIICMSGYAEDAFREQLGSARDIHFLAKPFSLTQLAGKVKEVLDKAARDG